jgi:predicted ABC-type ATPase
MDQPTLYLFGGCNGAGKTTFARAYLTAKFSKPLRFLNADEIARGLSPLSPERIALKAGKLLLSEIDHCLKHRETFGLESTLSGHAQANILKHAKSLGYRIEIVFLWIPSPQLAIRRIAQRVKKGGHHVPSEDVTRRYKRSLANFVKIYAPLADRWKVWNNADQPASLTLSSESATLDQLRKYLLS